MSKLMKNLKIFEGFFIFTLFYLNFSIVKTVFTERLGTYLDEVFVGNIKNDLKREHKKIESSILVKRGDEDKAEGKESDNDLPSDTIEKPNQEETTNISPKETTKIIKEGDKTIKPTKKVLTSNLNGNTNPTTTKPGSIHTTVKANTIQTSTKKVTTRKTSVNDKSSRKKNVSAVDSRKKNTNEKKYSKKKDNNLKKNVKNGEKKKNGTVDKKEKKGAKKKFVKKLVKGAVSVAVALG
jgi:hypothetical protein